ncbi:MAG TPA: pyruvate formate-lyase-activating protein [Mycobacterium sp.]|jgi:pyruvate formate lyase activating enzyme|nr:pyruvate formate-lyase-activating protein [Mycobacterium sp.]
MSTALSTPLSATPAPVPPAEPARRRSFVRAVPGTVPSGALHSWDVVTGTDGPGTRFVAFLAGCPLTCLYCHNPDTRTRRSGRPVTVEELYRRVAKFYTFLRAAGGGVTVSGGEPLLQPAFTEAFLTRCHQTGLHTALDTCGYLGTRASDALLDATDLVLLDIKSSEPNTYRRITARPLQPTIDFAHRLAERGNRMWVRFVLVPGLTDEPANVAGVADIAAELAPAVDRVEILGYHRLGITKWAQLGLDYPLADARPPTPGELAAAAAPFIDRGLTTFTV